MNTQVSQTGFNGEFSDPVLHQYILGNGYRAYNPALQRFTSPDSLSPFGKGGINPYIYCEGDPINRTDPTGHGPALWAIDLIDFGMMFVNLDKESTIVGGAEMTVGRTTKRAAEDTALDEGVSPKRPRGDGGIDNPITTSNLEWEGGPSTSGGQSISKAPPENIYLRRHEMGSVWVSKFKKMGYRVGGPSLIRTDENHLIASVVKVPMEKVGGMWRYRKDAKKVIDNENWERSQWYRARHDDSAQRWVWEPMANHAHSSVTDDHIVDLDDLESDKSSGFIRLGRIFR